MYSFTGNRAASVPMSAFICLWAIYIFPGSVHIFSCSRISWTILEIYKSLTDIWVRVGTGIQKIINSVLQITVLFLGKHKWEPDIYVGFSLALHLQCSVKKSTGIPGTWITKIRNLGLSHQANFGEFPLRFLFLFLFDRLGLQLLPAGIPAGAEDGHGAGLAHPLRHQQGPLQPSPLHHRQGRCRGSTIVSSDVYVMRHYVM